MSISRNELHLQQLYWPVRSSWDVLGHLRNHTEIVGVVVCFTDFVHGPPCHPPCRFISVSDLLWHTNKAIEPSPASDTVTNFSSACVHCTKAEKSFSNQYTELKLVKKLRDYGKEAHKHSGHSYFYSQLAPLQGPHPLRLQFKTGRWFTKNVDWSGLERRKEKEFVGGCKPAFAALSYWSLYWDCQALSNSPRSTRTARQMN